MEMGREQQERAEPSVVRVERVGIVYPTRLNVLDGKPLVDS